ncbi:MAG: hypothetical protein H0X27_01260 [Caulobacteraceae bacterium]|nr:hypothetical protein [Caulobacteraceae bacterium]
MSGLDALPDFGAPLRVGDAGAWRGFGQAVCHVLPSALEVARRPDGGLGVSLSLQRRADDLGAGGMFGVLDVELAAHYPLDEALASARVEMDGATARALPIELGYARLVSPGSASGLDEATLAPQPLGWSAAGGARWTQRVDPAAALRLKGALENQSLLLGARLEFTVLGVAARTPGQASFEPAALLAVLLGPDPGGPASAEALVVDLTRSLSRLPIEIAGEPDRRILPQILADRLFGAYGALTPAAAPADPARILFRPPAPGKVAWDLNQPVVVSRAFVLQLDMSAALAGAATGDLVREIVIPALDLGFSQVDIAANLPPNRIGAPMLGARVHVGANPPDRPSGITQTVLFTPPEDEGVARLRLAPGESLAYDLTCFAVIAAGARVSQGDGATTRRAEAWVRLQGEDFPVAFGHLSATSRLMDMAVIEGTLTWNEPGGTARQPFRLDKAAPDVAVAAPRDAEGALIELAAAPLDGGEVVALPSLALARQVIDLTAFPGYGPHRVPVSCDFSNSEAAVTVDLVGEDGANPATLTLTPSAPAATWGYVATSPFKAGWRYRLGQDWSSLMPFATALSIESEPAMPQPPKAPITPRDIDGVRLYAIADRPGVIFYIPAAPSPQDDGAGHPAVSVVGTAQTVMLQVGAQFTLTAGTRAGLLEKLGGKPAPDLQPAPISVRKAALLIADPHGAERELSTSSSSLYPPFAAVFAATLGAEEGARAIGAVNGAPGQLFVDYTIVPPAEAQMAGPGEITRRCDLAAWFPAATGRSHIQITA